MSYTNILLSDDLESLPLAQLLTTPKVISIQRCVEEIAHVGDNRLCFTDYGRVTSGAEGAGFDGLVQSV